MSTNPVLESPRQGSQKTTTRPPRYPEGFSDFAKWRYSNPKLDSHQFGLTIADIDQVIFHDSGEECYVMLLEVKSHGKTEIDVHEENIYNVCDSVFRLASRSGMIPISLWGRTEERRIRYMGKHFLVLSNTRPDNSQWMWWDTKYYINEEQLVRIMRFELPPQALETQTRPITKPTRARIETAIAHHRKRDVPLQGDDGRVIDWSWCLSTWDKLGRPIVYATPEDPVYDLSLYMYPERLSPGKLQGIATWLEQHLEQYGK